MASASSEAKQDKLTCCIMFFFVVVLLSGVKTVEPALVCGCCRGAEDEVLLCDQNVAAHSQHSIHDFDYISPTSRTLQPSNTLQHGL